MFTSGLALSAGDVGPVQRGMSHPTKRADRLGFAACASVNSRGDAHVDGPRRLKQVSMVVMAVAVDEGCEVVGYSVDDGCS